MMPQDILRLKARNNIWAKLHSVNCHQVNCSSVETAYELNDCVKKKEQAVAAVI